MRVSVSCGLTYNIVERNLTFEALTVIMEKYTNELGVDVKTDVDLIYSD